MPGFWIGSSLITNTDSEPSKHGTAKTRTLAALRGLTGLGAPRSAAWDVSLPEEKQARAKSLTALGGSISLDVFVREWEAVRGRWTPEEQADVLAAAMPRLQLCRPELGIAGLCRLLGDIPLHRTSWSIHSAPASAFAAIFRAGLPGEVRTEAGKKMADQLLENYSLTHPREASAWLRGNWEAGGRDYLRQCADAGWAGRLGFEAVEPFLKDGSITDLKNLVFTDERDLPARMKAIVEIPDPKTRDALVVMAGRSLHYASVKDARDALAQLPTGPVRDGVEKTVLVSIGLNRPEEIAEWLGASTLNQEAVGEVMKAAIKGGYATAAQLPELTDLALRYPDPAAGGAGITEALVRSAARASLAVEFVQSLPEGPVRASAESVLASSLAIRDPVAASRWADALPTGSPLRDDAAASLALSLRGDAEAARAWAESITDGSKRANVLQRLAVKGGG